MTAPLLKVSEKAQRQIEALIQKRGKPAQGVRISLKTRGCSGLSYVLTYADEAQAGDEHVPLDGGLSLFVDAKAVLFLVGTEMDFDENPLAPGFTFKNPNEKGRCGCQKSFHV